MDTARTRLLLLSWLFVANSLALPLTHRGRPGRRRAARWHNASDPRDEQQLGRAGAGASLGRAAMRYMSRHRVPEGGSPAGFVAGPPNVTGPDLAGEIVSLEVGTLGRPINSRHYLITFDPFDRRSVSERYERLPYAVTAAAEGAAPFFVNKDIPGCSSLNRYNPVFGTNPRLRAEQWHGERGDPHDCVPKNRERCCVLRCKHPQRKGVLQVRTVRLSTLIRQRGIRRIDMLKIDAQGSDSAIVQDVLSTNVTVRTIVAECQRYDKIHPIYAAQNDCDAMVKMVQKMRPGLYNVTWHVNNCLNAEYDLIFA